MDVSFVAKLKTYDDFIACYNEGDEKKLYDGESLLFYSISNNNVESRYLITDFLLNAGTEVNGINEYGENLLHILLSRVNHNIEQTTEMCRRLIDKGVDINQLDKRGRVPLQYLINMKYTDEECYLQLKHKSLLGFLLSNHNFIWVVNKRLSDNF